MDNHNDSFGPNRGEDEPIPVTPNANQTLLRPLVPKGVTFNKKVMMGLSAVIAVVCLFAMVHAFSAPAEKSSDDTAIPETELPKEASINGSMMMPKELESLSDSYEHARSSAFTAAQPGENQDMAQSSSIRFASLQNSNPGPNQPGAGSNLAQPGTKNSSYDEQNNQGGKNAFLRSGQSGTFYSASQLQPARSKYEVKATTIIPAVLITGIDSDLPGYITAQVRENVYDSVSGKYLLIPQGSRLMGLYDSKISYGQRRIMVVWNRMIFPNGASLDLEGIPGVDLSGYAGVTGKVNNHWGRLITGAVITSLLAVGTTKATNDKQVNTESAEEIAGAAMAMNISHIGEEYVNRELNVQPTIRVKPGAKFNIFVVKDFVLQPYTY
jgi:type IV secretory pathway VirB10-like protein